MTNYQMYRCVVSLRPGISHHRSGLANNCKRGLGRAQPSEMFTWASFNLFSATLMIFMLVVRKNANDLIKRK